MEINNKPSIIKFESIGSTQLGYITVAENGSKLPFEIKRTYWTYYTPNDVVRGNHAHKALSQIIFAVSGVIDFELENTAGEKYSFKLDKPDMGLYIPPLHWRVIKFSHSAVLLCLASEVYIEDDYIRSYDDFKLKF